MKFKPMLSVDATDALYTIKYPKYASGKLDGVRAIFSTMGLMTRSLKSIKNKQLREKFTLLLHDCREQNITLDGEFYAHNMTFQDIISLVTTIDFLDAKTIKKLEKEQSSLLQYYNSGRTAFDNPLSFHCFEMLNGKNLTFKEKLQEMKYLKSLGNSFTNGVVYVEQTLVQSPEETIAMFSSMLDAGYEGLILRDPESPYKYGRSTLKEEMMLKIKPFKTFDARITGVVQATAVSETAEKTINELGYSVTSKKKDDRVLIEKASAFLVDWDGIEQKVSLAMTDPEKEEVWRNKDTYIGKMIEFKGMVIGSKERIRHPNFVRFREDRD